MCGLAGIVMKKDTRTESELVYIKKSFENMLIEADTRGGHATGFAMIDSEGDYILCKKNKNANGFLHSKSTQASLDCLYDDVSLIMGHTRYATKGSPSINKNNHPIRAGHTIGTHNGSVSNDNELFRKFNMERHAQVDSEVVFRLFDESISENDFVDNRLKLIQGRVALVWSDLERPEYVYMVKANNPLELAYIPTLNIIAYGSTNQIIQAGFKANIQPIEVKKNTMLRINTKTLKIRRTDIKISEPKYSFSFNNKLGIDTDSHYKNTVSRFVPRFSHRDNQQSLFKEFKANDGSTIKKVK
jgi:glucosamine 6-phosphate synthetase-like amidotransferase/phosphosugar isomerase protein